MPVVPQQPTEATNYEVPLPRPATYQDWLTEFRDASKGAQPQLELTGAPTGWHPPASTTSRSHLRASSCSQEQVVK